MPTAKAPPSRRHLARVLSEAVPVVNEHANRLEYLKAERDLAANRLDALEESRVEDRALALPKSLTLKQRLSWLVAGRV